MIWTLVKTDSKVKLICIVICFGDTPYSMSQKPIKSILLLYFPSKHISSISPWIYAAQCISWSHQSINLEASRWWQARISRDTLGATASQLSDCTDMHPLHQIVMGPVELELGTDFISILPNSSALNLCSSCANTVGPITLADTNLHTRRLCKIHHNFLAAPPAPSCHVQIYQNAFDGKFS